MKITSSYKILLRGITTLLQPTVKIYRDALAFLVGVCDAEWDDIVAVEGNQQRQLFVERLVHNTKNRQAKYPAFDKSFYKMPSYLRRAAISEALGAVSSYRSNHANWVAGGKVGGEPKLQCDRNAMPTFFRGNMHLESDDPNAAHLKLFVNGDWVWVKVSLRVSDVRYLKRYWSHVKASAPTLEKRYGKYYLRFAFEESVALSDTPVADKRICAVDLGLNSDAVCNIMCSDGAILARKFINFPSEKDHLYTLLNRIKRFQREHGSHDVGSLWAYAKRCNHELAIKIAQAITDFAVLYSADVIVFEYLDFKGKKKKRKSKRQKLHMWKKNGIQELVTHKAHRCGIRISRICAWGTSKLAFDGSGEVERDKNNYALATFKNGKRYNCDLSASYNIGARYFIRELLKSLPATAESQIGAKVPTAARRTNCTYATLLQLNAALPELLAA